jgi:hypothetical protein
MTEIYYTMVLGDEIVEESGKITGQRVLDVDPHKMESSQNEWRIQMGRRE